MWDGFFGEVISDTRRGGLEKLEQGGGETALSHPFVG